jgi:hypothetical protein
MSMVSDHLAFAHHADPGVGHDDVEVAQFVDAIGDRLPHRGALADVADRGVASHRFLFDESRGFLEVLGPRQRVGVALQVRADVQRDDAGSLGGEIDCMGTALAPRRSRYNGDLVIELSH